METTEQAPASERTLTIKQACDHVGVSRPTIRGWINSGRLPATKIGTRIWRVAAADLDKLVQQ